MEEGAARVRALDSFGDGFAGEKLASTLSDLIFVVPGAPTPRNVAEAFKQGLAGEGHRRYGLSGVRCSRCGFVELYSEKESDP